MNDRIRELWDKAAQSTAAYPSGQNNSWETQVNFMDKFAELVVRECIDKIETYRIPVGNSRSGELACEWTYDALKEIRDDIKETFGVK
jgi:hypothetical protein